jgi:hypothetical protein
MGSDGSLLGSDVEDEDFGTQDVVARQRAHRDEQTKQPSTIFVHEDGSFDVK